MQKITNISNRFNHLKTRRDKLRKLLLNYINFLTKCLDIADSKNEVERILDSLKVLENKMWIQSNSDDDLTHNSYLLEERRIYQEIENIYLPH
jgi:hypothetical protein